MSADKPGGRSLRPEQTVDEPRTGSTSAIFVTAPVSGTSSSNSQTHTPSVSRPSDPGDEGWVGDRYRLVRVLGRGGHGCVYEAVHTHLDRHYALKVLGQPDEARGTKGRFEREAKLLSRLNHENVVGVIDAGIDPVRGQYLVLELVNGQTLANYIDKQVSLNTPLLISLIEQMASGLHHAHQQRIVHRDLKPENIMLSPQPDGSFIVKILDFGIAKLTEAGPEAITRSGWTLGTAAYMAPEQARGGRDLDERVDVFAFGVVVYEVLSGRRPFDGSSYNETLFKVVSQPHESILQHRPDLSKEVAAVLDRALCKERDGRYGSVSEFAGCLTAALRRSPGRVSLPPRRHFAASEDNAMLSTDVAPVSVLGAASRPPPIERWKVLTAVGVLIVAVVAWGLTSASTSADLQLPSSPMLSGHPLMEHAADNTGLAPGPTPGLQPDLGAAIPLPVNAAASSLEREPAAERPAAERPAAERPAAKRPTGGPGSEQGELQPSSAERAVVGRRSAAGNNRTLTGKGAAPASVNARVRQPSDSKTVPPPAPKPTPAKSAVPTGYVLDSPY